MITGLITPGLDGFLTFGLGLGPSVSPPLNIPSDEIAILQDIVDRLIATLAFDVVMLAESADATPATSDWQAYAVVWPTGGDDIDDAMTDGAADTVRHATFSIGIWSRSAESGDRQAALSRLAAVAKSAINHKSLAGMTLWALTIVRRDVRSPGSPPTGSITLSGEYSFIANDDDFADAYPVD